MIGRISDENDALKGLHLTYLNLTENTHKTTYNKLILTDLDGNPLPAKKMRTCYHGAIKGAAVRLTLATETLTVAEGIETALAARALFDLPIYATLSTYGMKHLILPPNLKALYLITDHDKAGKEAAAHLARRALNAGIIVNQWIPETHGTDALDELNRREVSA